MCVAMKLAAVSTLTYLLPRDKYRIFVQGIPAIVLYNDKSMVCQATTVFEVLFKSRRTLEFVPTSVTTPRASDDSLLRMADIASEDPSLFNKMAFHYLSASSGKSLPYKLAAIGNVDVSHVKTLLAARDQRHLEANTMSTSMQTALVTRKVILKKSQKINPIPKPPSNTL